MAKHTYKGHASPLYQELKRKTLFKGRPAPLSKEIGELLAEGWTETEIVRELGITKGAIQSYKKTKKYRDSLK